VFELNGLEARLTGEGRHASGLKCSTFGASALTDRSLAAGSAAGELTVWDLERPEAGPTWCAAAHVGAVCALDGVGGAARGAHGAPELATAGQDGALHVWDPRVRARPVVSFAPPAGAKAECWAAAFGDAHCDAERSLAAGYSTGDVQLFDLRTGRLRCALRCSAGGGAVCALEFDRREAAANKLVAACMDGCFSVWDARTIHAERGMARADGRTSAPATLWGVRHLPQDRDVWALHDGAGAAWLYSYQYPEKRSEKAEDGAEAGVAGSCALLTRATLSTQPLVSWDWSAEKRGLALCASVDQCVRVVAVSGL